MSSQFTTTTKDETARFAAAIGGHGVPLHAGIRLPSLGATPTARRGRVFEGQTDSHAHAKPWAWHPKFSGARYHHFGIVACALVVLAGCQQQMADQPSYKPLDASSFFTNGQSSRQLVAGTVARGHLEIDTHFYTGRKPGANRQAEAARTATPLPLGKNVGGPTAALDESQFVDTFPFPVTLNVLSHGRDRFLIYCAVCHDPRGTGRGKIVERGYTPPPSYHIPRLRSVPVGHLFAVVSEGYGSMPSYAGQISPRDRWAIVAYVKALQLSQHFPADKLSPEMKQEMQNTPTGKEVR